VDWLWDVRKELRLTSRFWMGTPLGVGGKELLFTKGQKTGEEQIG